MRTLKLSLFASALLLGSLTTVTAQTAEDIMNKHIAAVGGVDNWKKITSMKTAGTMSIQGNEVKVTNTMVQNKGMRMDMDITMGDQTINNYFILTTTEGWQYFPAMGQTKAEALPADAVKQSQDQLNLIDEVVKHNMAGSKATYVGKEKLDGKDCHKLTVTDKDGDVATMYFDATSGFLVKESMMVDMQGQKVESATSFNNYKKLAEGISVPMFKGNPAQGEMTLTSVEVNKPIDQSIFKVSGN